MSNKSIIKVQKTRLVGQVAVSGAKNAALKHLAASILTDQPIELSNSPNGLLDMRIHVGMLERLGKVCKVTGSCLEIKESNKLVSELIWTDRSIRNSLLILGALIARFGEGRVPLPGGCNLGERKYDLHLMIFEKMGAKVWEEEGYLFARVDGKLRGCDIHLPIRSTGATENAILCGTLALGKTTLWNPHIRPEILDLVDMLNDMGAHIRIFGQRCVEIDGVDHLHGVRHSVIPDNMEAITWAIASVITNGDIEILNFPFDHLEVPLIFLRESGMKFYRSKNSLIVRGGTPYPVEISTGPYPGINSDMQPLFAVYGACAMGETKIVDLRFPGRYHYAEELAKMGILFNVEKGLLKIHGGEKLYGARVKALDLRAGIALLLAGLTAEGDTIIEDAWQIERGYENLLQKIQGLGGN